jgi:hypothetical protein
MAEAKKIEKKPYQDPWETDQSNWEYFTCPQTDIFGKAHPGFSLNKHDFRPGQRYLVPPEVAKELNERSQIFNTYTARLLQDTIDYDALRKVGSLQ